MFGLRPFIQELFNGNEEDNENDHGDDGVPEGEE